MDNNFFSKENYIPTSKFTEIIYDINLAKSFLGIEYDFHEDDTLIWVLMDASSSYVRNYTQMSDEDLNKYHESSLVFLMLMSEFYLNRSVSLSTGNNGIFNKMLDKIMKSLKQDWL